MNLVDSIVNLLKGRKHAGESENGVSGGHGCERRGFHTVSSVSEQALSDFRSIRVLAATCADERGRNTGSLSADPICRESCALIAAAKKTGCFIETKDVPGTRYTIRTGESEVRLVQKDGQMGLVKCGRYEFGNDFLFVTDVGQDGDNVLLDDDGAIRFIDPIVGFKSPLLIRLKGALESEYGITALVNDLYRVKVV